MQAAPTPTPGMPGTGPRGTGRDTSTHSTAPTTTAHPTTHADGVRTVRVRVPAKINLALCVDAPQGDGFHPLGTVFQAISLHDELTATLAPAGVFSITVEGEGVAFVPQDERNLAMQAALLLARDAPGAGARLHITKAIPVAGGMAGGSADAAAALLACSTLWRLGLSLDELQGLGAGLGSDVPFPLLGGTALGTGRGHLLSPVADPGTLHWVLALAHGGLSTPTVFARFDEIGQVGGTEVPADLLAALAAGDAVAVGRSLRNDLQPAALALRPELGETLDAGRAAGALGALVSGSGPTCAFLASDRRHAEHLARHLATLPGVRATRTATGAVPGARVVA